MPSILSYPARAAGTATLSLATMNISGHYIRIKGHPATIISHFSKSTMAQVSDDERAAFKATFDIYDKNKDGHISSSELKTVLNKLGQQPSDEEVAEFIRVCDKDKNGTIELDEFCRYLHDLRKKVFNEIDADGNGYITAEEVVVGFMKLGVPLTLDEAKALVKACDKDGDGRISYAEFVASMTSRPL